MSSKTFWHHLLLSVGTRLAMIGLRLLRNVLLARILGPSERGLFALLSALPDLLAAVSSGGLNTALGFQAAQQRSMALLLTQLVVFGCLAAGLLTLCGALLVDQFGAQVDTARQLGPLIWILLLAVPLTILKSGLLTLHNGDGRVVSFNALRLLESLAPLALFLALFWMWQSNALQAAVISWLLGIGLVAVVGWCWLGRFHQLRLRWDARSHRELLRYSGKSHPDVLFQQVLLRSDYLFIGAFIDSEALGYYAMATAAAELLLIVPEAVTTPLMKRLLRQGEGIKQLTPFALRITATVMFAACTSMALLGEWLIVGLFGKSYAPAYPALLALLPGLFGLCYASILRLDLLGKNRPGSVSLLMGAGAVLNVVLNLLLIPPMGIVGAGLASSAAYLMVSLAMLMFYCRLSQVSLAHTLFILPSDLARLRPLLKGGEITP